MADYPAALAQVTGSREQWRDPAEVSYSRAGGFKARRLQSAKKRGFVVEHKFLTSAERSTLEAFYDANRTGTFNFAWNDAPGDVYVVAFASKDGLTFQCAKGLYWDVSVELSEA